MYIPTENTEVVQETTVSTNINWQPETREQRLQLQALSKELFGTSSKYRKLYSEKTLITHTETQVRKHDDGTETTDKLQVPTLLNGVRQYKMTYRNTEQVLQLLLDAKVKLDNYRAELKKHQEEAASKKAAEETAVKLQEELAGSAH